MNILLKILGVILLIAGFVLAYKPDLMSSQPMPSDPYQMIEKRVMWGLVIGLGILFIFHHQLSPWQLSVSALLSALTLGIVLARLLGLVMDGIFTKQLLWLAIEIAFLLIFGFWYWKQK
ncbi:DUF4345 family protein (plasmid) [Chondrinema litorale]|nr:DUF4345 family protein [Chondrinema litorale]UZR99728.1 DUF4345 family protein [Chondrinema litorale]